MSTRLLYLADIRFPIERANGIQTIETCHALARRGVTVHLLVRDDTHTPARDPFAYYGLDPIDTLRITRVAMRGTATTRRLRYLAAAVRHASAADVDIVFTRDLLLAEALLRRPRLLRRQPVIYESHGVADDVAAQQASLLSTGTAAPPRKQRRLARRDGYVLRHADGYITITDHLQRVMTSRFGERTHVLIAHDGVRANDIRRTPQRSRNSACRVVGYAGHLYPWKGVDVFLEAVARVPDLEAVIIGGHPADADLDRLRALAETLGIAGRVRFTGLVPPRDVARHLDAADLVVLPNTATTISSYYSSPLKLFEYLAAGRVIVASDLPAVREVVTHDREAWLVAAGNAAALSAGMALVAADPDRAQRLAQAALVRAHAFTWDVRAEGIAGLVASLQRARP